MCRALLPTVATSVVANTSKFTLQRKPPIHLFVATPSSFTKPLGNSFLAAVIGRQCRRFEQHINRQTGHHSNVFKVQSDPSSKFKGQSGNHPNMSVTR